MMNYEKEMMLLGFELAASNTPITMTQGMREGLKDAPAETQNFVLGYYESTRRMFNKMEPEARLVLAREGIRKHQELGIEQNHIDGGPQITCKKGCSFCCYQMVSVTDAEGALIAKKYPQMVAQALEVLKGQQALKTSMDYTKAFPKGRCAFLQAGGECGIYEDRPLVCRVVLSVGDPNDCRVDGNATSMAFFLNLLAEATISAFWNSDGQKLGPLPEKVLV